MGGDHGVSVVVPAALHMLDIDRNLKLILVGNESLISEELRNNDAATSQRLTIKHATQTVEMDESPAQALRGKKDSSMRVAINLVKHGEADACVSAGNTGALMATARFVLKTLPGIDRPALISTVPAMKGHTHILDLGANVDVGAEHLFQFAVMGSVLTSAVDNIKEPSVGLLNIGEEDMKGNERIKEAARLLSDSEINYIGFVEGDDIYKGSVDVVVCDGFVGNVALKSSEGVAKMLSGSLKEEFGRNWLTKLAALIAMPVLKAFRNNFDPRQHNGASLVGLKGIVVKSHGGADSFAFENAIKEAVREVKKDVPKLIDTQLHSLLLEKRNAL